MLVGIHRFDLLLPILAQPYQLLPMSYTDLIKNSKEKVYHHAIATKILDLMEKLRMDDKGKSKRRWVWELLQNAKDVQYTDKPVKVDIHLNSDPFEDFLEFKHNGKPFSIDNITFLIEQVSTKERTVANEIKPKTTGKFGTGFLTTHLLSEKVVVNGFVKEPQLPYKKFNLQLDRSGSTIEEIIESIAKSTDVLREIENVESSNDYNEESLNTKFSYSLDREGLEVAKIGLDDLEKSLPMTLVFVEAIRSVDIIHEGVTFTLLNTIIDQGSDIIIYSVQRGDLLDERIFNIAVLNGRKATIAIPVSIHSDQSVTIDKIPDFMPKLFCDFPLIGTEDLSLPFILNSSSFNPNEPRNGVFLTDRQNDKITENKAIFSEAIELYDKLLIYATEHAWSGIYELANVDVPTERDWLSQSYFEEYVIDPIHNFFGHAKIVKTESGDLESILNDDDTPRIWFPYAAKKEVREQIWALAKQWIPSLIPAADIHNWFQILWKQCGKLSVKEITSDIHSFANLKELESKIITGSSINWLNEYFDLLNYEGKVIDEVISEKYKVIPNQNGIFKKMTELYFDSEIDEQFKDILLALNDDIRDQLRHKSIVTRNKSNKDADNQIKHHTRKSEDLVNKINKILIKAANDDEVLDTCLELIALSPREDTKNKRREDLLAFAKKIFSTVSFQSTLINFNDPAIWVEADKIVIRKIVYCISECQNILTFTDDYHFISEENALDWLNKFVLFLFESGNDHYLNEESSAILPNQKGNFVIKDVLFLDDGSIGKGLKDIAESLDYEIRSDLLEVKIYFELPDNRVLNDRLVAEKITALVVPKLSELPRSETTKDSFRLIYLWFRDNREKAELIFQDLYINRHKLYDDDEVADNMAQAENLKQLLDDFNITTIDELRDIIATTSHDNKPKSGAEPITKETLASLGIGSLSELEVALQDVNLAKVFLHNSEPTVEMFAYAQRLIQRSMNNILEHLKTLEEYDCEGAEQTAPTVLGGIKYNGYDINVVTRPSDNREVIIYYSSEKDVLELPESQLWIDDGISIPRLLTLGTVLKITGITKIPI